MSRLHVDAESHNVDRIGWLRAAVLGANDGIVSTASLIVGVPAASARPSDILLTGVAGLVAGAMSMAAGEYVSVSSQSDTEHADLARETKELANTPEFEREELAQTFAVGAAMPLAMVLVAPVGKLVPIVTIASLGFLALLGAVGARAGGADIVKATARVTFWGALAMAATAGIGKLFGAVV